MNDPSVRPNAIWLPSASKAQLLIFWSTDIFEIASKLFMFQSLKIFYTHQESSVYSHISDKYNYSICVWRKCFIHTLKSGHHFQLQRWASLDVQLRPITLPLRGHQQYSGVCPGLVQSPQISDCPVSRSGLYPPANTHCAPTGLKKKNINEKL